MRIVTTSIVTAICLLTSYPTQAGSRAGCTEPTCGTPSCCAQCGGHRTCQKRVRRMVCEMKEVKKVCWGVECEVFQPLRPAGLAKTGCGSSCGVSCGTSCDPTCGQTCRGCNRHECVTCCEPGKARCKKKLMKREITVNVPVYKCVVEYVCPGCCSTECAEGQPVEPASPATAHTAPAKPLPPFPTNRSTGLLISLPM
jgi:hypothetical protein